MDQEFDNNFLPDEAEIPAADRYRDSSNVWNSLTPDLRVNLMPFQRQNLVLLASSDNLEWILLPKIIVLFQRISECVVCHVNVWSLPNSVT